MMFATDRPEGWLLIAALVMLFPLLIGAVFSILSGSPAATFVLSVGAGYGQRRWWQRALRPVVGFTAIMIHLTVPSQVDDIGVASVIIWSAVVSWALVWSLPLQVREDIGTFTADHPRETGVWLFALSVAIATAPYSAVPLALGVIVAFAGRVLFARR